MEVLLRVNSNYSNRGLAAASYPTGWEGSGGALEFDLGYRSIAELACPTGSRPTPSVPAGGF